MSSKEDMLEECDTCNQNITMTEDGEQTTPVLTATVNHVSMDDIEHDGQTTNRKSLLSSTMKETVDEEQPSDPNDNNGKPPLSCPRRLCRFFLQIYQQHEFLIHIVLAICLARAYPPLGAEYLQPQITSTWVAVIFIFLLAGLGLKTEEFSKAFQRLRFNLFVQIYSFGVDSAVVFGVSRALLSAGALSPPLANGMVVCASLSMTINMVMVMTKSAGGDEASAVFHAAVGNMLGVFLSPLLILGYLGVTGSVAMGEIFYGLAVRVVLPIVVGQIIRKFSPPTVAWYTKHKQTFKKAQEWALVFIVYTVFCRTFAANADDESKSVQIVDIVIMTVVEFACLVSLMGLAWVLLRLFFPKEPKLIVMGVFGCTHKTMAMGVPLINAIYEDDANIGLITLPLLIWHTMQLILGSFLAPKLAKWVEEEEERLGNAIDEGNEEVEAKQNTSELRELDNSQTISAIPDSSSDNESNGDGKATSEKPTTALADIEQGESDVESA